MLRNVVTDFDNEIKNNQPLCMAFLAHLSYHTCSYIEAYFKKFGVIEVHTFELDDLTRGFVAEFESFVCVSFKGTAARNNMHTLTKEFMFWKRIYGGVRVHAGFADIMDGLVPLVKEKIKLVNKTKPIYFTGHSLGGALATLMVLDVKPACVYTFGAPKVSCGHKFNEHFKHVPYYRYCNLGDAIPFLPMWFLGYAHPAPAIVLKSAFNPFASHSSPSYVLALKDKHV